MKTESERAKAYIHLKFLEENLRAIRSFLSPDTKTLCVVKAQAYGHGGVKVSRLLEQVGVDYLGVAGIKEAIELRKNDIRLPVLVMSGILPWEDLGKALTYDLTLVVYDMDTLKRIVKSEPSLNRSLNIHVKVDTGMGRLGFRNEELPEVAGMILSSRNIVCEGLMSHFALSEIRDGYGLEQIDRFRSAKEIIRSLGITPPIAHMANSGAIVQYPEAHFDMVRTGIHLYGSFSDRTLASRLNLKQVMKFTSRVALIREFPAGSVLSYGRTYTATKLMKVAYVPVGYADGYPRSLSNRGFVLINDRKCFIVGIVCMDWFLADVTDLDDVKTGDEVILMGYDVTQSITADEIAELAGTIPYEILCKISKRVPRVYV